MQAVDTLYIYIYIYSHMYIYTYMCTHAHTCLDTYLPNHVSIYPSIQLPTCTYTKSLPFSKWGLA